MKNYLGEFEELVLLTIAVLGDDAYGVSIKDATLFCTNMPCSICAKMIINAGIKKICYHSGYADAMSEQMFTEAGIDLIQFDAG